MGYYTNHDLEVVSGGDIDIDYHEIVNEASGYGGMDIFEEECKWYSHRDDMRVVSKRHTGVLFKLSGEGEESGDLWIEYHKDGKVQAIKGVITFEDYDESKLS